MVMSQWHADNHMHKHGTLGMRSDAPPLNGPSHGEARNHGSFMMIFRNAPSWTHVQMFQAGIQVALERRQN